MPRETFIPLCLSIPRSAYPVNPIRRPQVTSRQSYGMLGTKEEYDMDTNTLLFFDVHLDALPLFEAGWCALASAARLTGRIWHALRQHAQALGLAEKCGSFAKKFVKPPSIFGRKGIK